MLVSTFSNVGRVASSKTGLPILSNILLRTDGNRLLIAATNLEIASTHYIGAKIASPGAITIPARLVSDFVSSLPKGTVDLKANGSHLTISSGNFKSVINGVLADEFPELHSSFQLAVVPINGIHPLQLSKGDLQMNANIHR